MASAYLRNDSPVVSDLDSAPSATAPGREDKGDNLWTEYLTVAEDHDERLIADWKSIIDTILVCTGLLTGVLTAFIIQTSTEFERDPIKINNDLLAAMYDRSFDPSLPKIDTRALFDLDPAQRSGALFRNTMLYISVSLTILISGLSSACKIWVIRYTRSLKTAGSPFARAIARQRAFNGMKAWKFEAIIESLPLLALAAFFLFGLFMYSYVLERHTILGYVVGVFLMLGFAVAEVLSLSAAFVPTAPFQSFFSDIIGYISHVLPDRGHVKVRSRPIVRRRTVWVLIVSLASFVVSAFLIIRLPPVFGLGVVALVVGAFPVCGTFALIHPGEEKDMKPRILNIPAFTLLSTIIIYPVVILSACFSTRSGLVILLSSLGAAIVHTLGYIRVKMSKSIPRTVEAEAVAWIITASASEDPSWYEKAAKIAGTSPNLRALLLERLLPLLTRLITPSGLDGRRGSVTPEQVGYIDCLATLADFAGSKRHFLRNEAPVRHVPMPLGLHIRLDQLTRARCPTKSTSDLGGGSGGCVHVDTVCPYERVRASAALILQKFQGDEDTHAGLDDKLRTIA